jgi:hypothetical protein
LGFQSNFTSDWKHDQIKLAFKFCFINLARIVVYSGSFMFCVILLQCSWNSGKKDTDSFTEYAQTLAP